MPNLSLQLCHLQLASIAIIAADDDDIHHSSFEANLDEFFAGVATAQCTIAATLYSSIAAID